jgi:hypothetical protein
MVVLRSGSRLIHTRGDVASTLVWNLLCHLHGHAKARSITVRPKRIGLAKAGSEIAYRALFGELAAFNERIAELAKQGHQSLAMDVLKAQAMSLAAQIDELRCILIVPKQ